MKIDKQLIKQLSEYLDEFKLTEIEFTEKDTKIKVSKNNFSTNNQTTSVTENISTIKENTTIEMIAIKKLLAIAAKIIAIETSTADKGA